MQKHTILNETEEVLQLDSDGKVTLPGGIKIKAIGRMLAESKYGNQIRRNYDSGAPSTGTFEAVARGKRANGIVQGYIIIPKGMEGVHDGGDEGTIILKDNHADDSDGKTQYKIQFEYQKGGRVDGIKLGREHDHDSDPGIEKIKNVIYENQPHFEAGGKLDFVASYQDTKDGGVRLRMFYKNETGLWVRLFDHVDYGDGKSGRPYRGKSGVQDGTRIDGGVKGYLPSKQDREEYKKCKDKLMSSVQLNDKLREIFSKLATSAIYAREIEPENSDLHDGIDDPLSFGDR